MRSSLQLFLKSEKLCRIVFYLILYNLVYGNIWPTSAFYQDDTIQLDYFLEIEFAELDRNWYGSFQFLLLYILFSKSTCILIIFL